MLRPLPDSRFHRSPSRSPKVPSEPHRSQRSPPGSLVPRELRRWWKAWRRRQRRQQTLLCEASVASSLRARPRCSSTTDKPNLAGSKAGRQNEARRAQKQIVYKLSTNRRGNFPYDKSSACIVVFGGQHRKDKQQNVYKLSKNRRGTVGPVFPRNPREPLS